jgi:hypothetical protein
MKIDIEGGEVGFLRGTSETQRRCRPIVAVDLHGTNAPVSSLLEELGYGSIVLGSQEGIVDSPREAGVIARGSRNLRISHPPCWELRAVSNPN